ncbi:MAG: D-ribose pyranase [Eubacteriales bacterium]|jgi:D-ribose pyranase
MKKNGILNSDISRVLSYMGHTDRICIGDCGLPVPDGTERIDLALRFGEPSFMDVLEEVAGDMKIEKIILAEEMKEQNPEQLQKVLDFFERYETGFKDGGENSGTPEVIFVSHAELKKATKDCKAVIRTGETTPYSNIILQSACIF